MPTIISTTELTTTEAAERIGVPVGTLKGWLGKIPVPVTIDSAGKRRIGPEALEVLERIKALRLDEGRGMETIRRRLVPAASEPKPGLTPDTSSATAAEAEPSPGRVGASADDVARVVTDAVAQAIEKQTGLAEKYARATYTIGQLEERTATLQAQLAEARDRIALLEAPKPEPEAEPTPAKLNRPWWALKLW